MEPLIGQPQLGRVWTLVGDPPVSTAVMRMPSCSSISAALVRVSMFSAAFAMLVCGCPGPLYARLNCPSIADTFTTYVRREGEAAIADEGDGPANRWVTFQRLVEEAVRRAQVHHRDS
jgi:hypothetical protein